MSHSVSPACGSPMLKAAPSPRLAPKMRRFATLPRLVFQRHEGERLIRGAARMLALDRLVEVAVDRCEHRCLDRPGQVRSYFLPCGEEGLQEMRGVDVVRLAMIEDARNAAATEG